VVIVEGQALIDARMQASLRGLEEGVAFVEGHSLDDAASKAMVPAKAIGRMLSIAEAKTVLKQKKPIAAKAARAPNSPPGPWETANVVLRLCMTNWILRKPEGADVRPPHSHQTTLAGPSCS
jgi:hypothetical protein